MSWFQLEHSWFFLRSVWYDAVVALREEHIYILSCWWAVLHRTNNIVGFQLLVPFWQWGGKEGTRSREGKESECWPELAKGIFHLMWHHAKKKKKNPCKMVESWLVSICCLGTGRASVNGRCFVHHFILFIYIITIILFPFPFSLSKYFLSQPMSSTLGFLWYSLPSHWVRGCGKVNEWASYPPG